MLEKPDIRDENIIACLLNEYGLLVVQVIFLPLGADLNTAVYRVVTDDETAFCERLFLTNEGGEDREQSLQYLKSNFLPNSTIEIAYQSDKTMGERFIPNW